MMNGMKQRAAQQLIRRIAPMLGMETDPLQLWRELPTEIRVGTFAALELAQGAAQLAPPPPSPELQSLFQMAALEEGVAAELLQAVSWEVARYGDRQAIAQAAGPMGLPAEYARASLYDQVLGCARALRTTAQDVGLAGALVAYTGSRELAAAITGTTALLFAARIGWTHEMTGTLRGLLGDT